MVECGGLESRCTPRGYRGFESLPHRNNKTQSPKSKIQIRDLEHMEQTVPDFGERTLAFGLRVLDMCIALPRSMPGHVLGKQLLKAGTSVGAHYAEASHSRSVAEFVSKIDGARQEIQETLYWLALIQRSGLADGTALAPLIQEANEIRAILITMSRNAGKRG